MAKNIQLTDSQIEDLQRIYQIRLEKAERRVQEFKSILATLNATGTLVQSAASEPESVDETEEAAPSKATKKKKKKTAKGKKPRWSDFVIEFLQEKDRLVRVEDIIAEALEAYEVPEEGHKKTEQAIHNSLQRLVKVNNALLTYSIPGKRGRYYGLKDWFTDNGSVRDDYARKSQLVVG